MTQSTHIKITTSDRITTIRFDRPDKKNAITGEMYGALAAGLEAAAQDPAVRAVVIGGTRDCFTSGNDLGDFLRTAQGATEGAAVYNFLRAIATFEKPLIAAVNGVAIGVGTTMLLHCDLVFASPTARFKLPFVDLALVPEAGSSVLLPALVGARRAAQLLLLSEQLSAATALDWGLVNAVAEDPDAQAEQAAKQLASRAPGSLRTTKALLRRTSRDEVLEAMQIENEAFRERLRSPEALEALQAFMERRPADFSKF